MALFRKSITLNKVPLWLNALPVGQRRACITDSANLHPIETSSYVVGFARLEGRTLFHAEQFSRTDVIFADLFCFFCLIVA